MAQYITRLTIMVLLIELLTGTGFATATQDPSPECIGIEKTAQKPWILYDSNPKPFPLLPLIVSDVNQIGAISPGQQLTICKRVDRSTWNRRSAWVQVRINTRNDYSGPQSGWITMSRDEADTWIPER